MDRRTRTAGGVDFNTINPKGYVPALQLDDGQVVTENVVVLQFIADRYPAAKLAPPPGTMERYRLMEWLSFINSEIHKGFSPLFDPEAPEAVKQYARAHLEKRLNYLQTAMGAGQFLTGDHFTIGDAYLFTVLGWGGHAGIDVGRWPALKGFADRIRSRPHVVEALTAEGLIKK